MTLARQNGVTQPTVLKRLPANENVHCRKQVSERELVHLKSTLFIPVEGLGTKQEGRPFYKKLSTFMSTQKFQCKKKSSQVFESNGSTLPDTTALPHVFN